MQTEDSTASADISNLPPEDWFKRFVYVSEGDYYFDVVERQEYGRASFNAIYRGVPLQSVHNKQRRVEAATFFDENRAALGSRLLTGLTYAAGESGLSIASITFARMRKAAARQGSSRLRSRM